MNNKYSTFLAVLGLVVALSGAHAFDIKSMAITVPRLIPGWTVGRTLEHVKQQPQQKQQRLITVTTAVPQSTTAVTTFEEAVRLIDECAVQEKTSEELYQAVRFVERNAYKIYHDTADRQALWDRAQGCFKLVLTTGDAKTRAFHAPSYIFPFSFAMIQGEYFGNGFGWNENMIWVSILQKHYWNVQRRQMVVTVKDIYLAGRRSTDGVPAFVRDAINAGKTPQDFGEDRPPAFCLVAATEHALVARGNQSGGLAIWKRLDRDLRPAAYKDIPSTDDD